MGAAQPCYQCTHFTATNNLSDNFSIDAMLPLSPWGRNPASVVGRWWLGGRRGCFESVCSINSMMHDDSRATDHVSATDALGVSNLWQAHGRLEVAEAHAPLPPPARVREFCVLNAFDGRRRTFVSKSIQHASMPGSSRYATGGAPPNGRVRALNTFALRTSPAPALVPTHGLPAATLELINYADLDGSTTLMNWVNVQAFLQGLIERLEARLARR